MSFPHLQWAFEWDYGSSIRSHLAIHLARQDLEHYRYQRSNPIANQLNLQPFPGIRQELQRCPLGCSDHIRILCHIHSYNVVEYPYWNCSRLRQVAGKHCSCESTVLYATLINFKFVTPWISGFIPRRLVNDRPHVPTGSYPVHIGLVSKADGCTGTQTFSGKTGIPLATVASMEATRHTAAGVVLLGPDPLFPLGIGLLGLPGLCDFFRPGLRDDFLPFLPLDVDLAGVACLGLPDGPSWENLHLAPLSHRPHFQKIHSFLPFPLGDCVLDGERPRLLSLLGFVERSLLEGTSCLHGQFSIEQPKLFHLTH